MSKKRFTANYLTMAGLGPATQSPRVRVADDSLLADARYWVAGTRPAMVKFR